MASDSPPPAGPVDGLILAGGQSRRMRTPDAVDADKGLREWQGRPLVEQVARYLREQGIGRIHISANRHPDDYARHGNVVADPPDLHDCGPLAGVLAGLRQTQSPWLFILPVDVVRWPEGLLARLCAAATPSRPAYARTADGPHPLCLVVHRRMLPGLEDFLRSGQRQVQAWLRACEARAVDFPGADCLVNLNTPEDWLRWASAPAAGPGAAGTAPGAGARRA